MSQCSTQVNRDAARCACLCERKPDARQIQRFHLLCRFIRPPHTAKRGLSPLRLSKGPAAVSSHGPAGLHKGRWHAWSTPSRSPRFSPSSRFSHRRRRPRLRHRLLVVLGAAAHRRRHGRRRQNRGRAPDAPGRARRRKPAQGSRARGAGKGAAATADAERQIRAAPGRDPAPRAGAGREDAGARPTASPPASGSNRTCAPARRASPQPSGDGGGARPGRAAAGRPAARAAAASRG